MVLSSSATSYQVEPVARFLGIDLVLCNRFTTADGLLTGEVETPVLWGAGKADAVDKAGATVDFLLTAKRDRKAALRFLRKAIRHNGPPERITIDKSGANTAAIESYNDDHEVGIEIRQVKYLNNIVEQDHWAIKRLTRSMLGFKSFWSAAATLSDVKLMHMVRGHAITV